MAAENWIDAVTALWAGIDDGRGRKVHAYSVFKKSELPESITEFPCAITYISRISKIQYSASGPNIVIYQGVTEFHVTPGVNKQNYPALIRYIDRIIKAAASSVTLGGLVSHFLLSVDTPIDPGILRYGSEEPHLGLIVNWEVKEMLTMSVGA